MFEGAKPELFDGARYYATTKVFTSWWSATMARRYGPRISVFTVSPGSNMTTNEARHTTGFKNFLYTKIMPALGPTLGMSLPIPVGAKRYVDVLNSRNGDYVNGKSYMSKPKKLVGPIQESNNAHLLDVERQEALWNVIVGLTETASYTVQKVLCLKNENPCFTGKKGLCKKGSLLTVLQDEIFSLENINIILTIY